MHALVTGGGGFLGKAIVTRLLQRGDSVRSLSRGVYPELRAMGAEVIQGDVADANTVLAAATDCDVLVHVAAKAGIWGPYADYHHCNVVGTENVVAACLAGGIKKLIFTSSPSVVFDGHDESGIDETAAYSKHFLAHYPRSKAMAEKVVLNADGKTCRDGETLNTVALRPHLIWGPGDNHLIPRLIDRARRGQLRKVGSGKNLVDMVYIDNAADAHLQAADCLTPNSSVAGHAFFISNGEPQPLWVMIDKLLACAHLPPVKRSISATTAYCVGGLLEMIYAAMNRSDEPPMTRFVARQLSTSHWFRMDAAQNAFGYQPRVSNEEGLQRLAEWLRLNPA